MNLAAGNRTPALHVLALTLLSTPLTAQDVCPQASGRDAEAGWAAYSANDMEVARSRFESALARCANDHYARTGLGYVELREGRDSVAVALWSGVLEDQPATIDALTGLGLAAWRAGDVDEVSARFSRVLELDPDHPAALDYLDRLTLAGPPPQRPPLTLSDTLVYYYCVIKY